MAKPGRPKGSTRAAEPTKPLQVRVSESQLTQFNELCQNLGLNTSMVVRMFVTEAVQRGKLPLEWLPAEFIPNLEEIARRGREAEQTLDVLRKELE